jgi:putative transcriptional regulator
VKRDAVDGTALVSCVELADQDDPEEVRDLIRERAREPAD